MRKTIQRIFYKLFGKWGALTIQCKQCDFDSPFAFGAFYHIKHKHPNSKISKKEYLFVFKHNLIFRFLMCCFILIMRIIGLILWLITYPFWALHELID